MSWWEEAACKGAAEDVVDVVPNPGKPSAETRRRQAAQRALCAACPVRSACLADAMRTERGEAAHRYGIRGGLLPSERERLATGQPLVKMVKPPPPPPPRKAGKPRPLKHGTLHAYQNRGCRCDDCRAAGTAYQRLRRSRARARAGT